MAGSLGFGGTRALTRSFAVAPALNFGNVAAGSSAELTTPVAGLLSGDWVVVNPAFAIPAGVTWEGYCTPNGTAIVRVTNATAAAVAVSGTFRIITLA